MTRVLLDTSVLVPALLRAHPHHADAAAQFARVQRGEAALCVAAHALAEAYATLTALPLVPRLAPARVGRMLSEGDLAAAEVVALDGADYTATIGRVAALGLASGAVYDALHVRAAEKARCDELVTFNGAHFQRFPPAPPVRLVVL